MASVGKINLQLHRDSAESRQEGIVLTVLKSIFFVGKTLLKSCSFTNYVGLDTFIKKKGLFCLMVPKIQGQGAISSEILLASRIPRLCMVSHGKNKECTCVCASSGL